MERFVDQHLSEMIAQLSNLVSLESVYDPQDSQHPPFGKGVSDALQAVLDLGRSFDMQVRNVDGYVGEITVGTGSRMIGILCHIDVVPAGAGWNTEPFTLTERDGRLYGRGSSDDKGPLISALYAMRYLQQSGQIPDDCCLRLIVGANEEESWQCIRHYLAHTTDLPSVSIVPDGNFPLIFCEKGLLDFDLHSEFVPNHRAPIQLAALSGGTSRNMIPDAAQCVLLCADEATATVCQSKLDGVEVVRDGLQLTICAQGKSAHCMTPEKGISAIARLMEALCALKTDFSHAELAQTMVQAGDYTGSKLGLDMQDEVSGALTLNLGVISMDASGAVHIQADIRYPASASQETVQKQVRSALTGFGYTEVDHLPPVYFEPNDPLVRTLLDAYQQVTGDRDSQPLAIGGATYARALPCAVAFGPLFPWEEELAHEPNEFLSIDSLRSMTQIYICALRKLMEM